MYFTRAHRISRARKRRRVQCTHNCQAKANPHPSCLPPQLGRQNINADLCFFQTTDRHARCRFQRTKTQKRGKPPFLSLPAVGPEGRNNVSSTQTHYPLAPAPGPLSVRACSTPSPTAHLPPRPARGERRGQRRHRTSPPACPQCHL